MTYDSNRTSGAAVPWRKSSFSGEVACVEVARVDDAVALRDSIRPELGALVFEGGQMAAWVDACKSGQFDDLSI